MQRDGHRQLETNEVESMGNYDDNRRAQSIKTLVIGMGQTGLSCVRFLLAKGHTVAVWDSRMDPPSMNELAQLLPSKAINLGPFDVARFSDYQQIIVSPGVSVQEPAIIAAQAQGIEVIGDIELFVRHATAPVIAITGSNGKSTVSALVAAMLERCGCEVRLGGNFGVPALDLLAGQQPDVYVLELSSFQLETLSSLNAVASVVLNISPDHMDRYEDLAAYLTAKQRIWSGQGVVVVNRDEPELMSNNLPGRSQLGFTLAEPGANDYGVLAVAGQPWLARGDKPLLAVTDLKLAGWHNVANALAALALARTLLDVVATTRSDLRPEGLLLALREFRGLPHRMEWVAESNGVSWYNDSKGTNAGATLAALKGLDQPVVLIAGGLAKGGDFLPLRPVLADRGRAVVLIGRDARLIESALADVVTCVHAGDMDQAVTLAGQLAHPGDVVLLSPACASFDMFKGYDHRGQVFVESVRRAVS